MKNKPLSFEDLEKMAYRGQAMPKYMPLPDQMCYLCLRCLYDAYRRKNISKRDAMREKKAIRQGFEENRRDFYQQFAMYAQYQEDIRSAGSRRTEIIKGCRQGMGDRELLLKACECIGYMTGDAAFLPLCRKALETSESKDTV